MLLSLPPQSPRRITLLNPFFEGRSLLSATFVNGAACAAEGVVLDGVDDYIAAAPFEFGGPVSFEVYVKYDSFGKDSPLFDFGGGAASDNVILYNENTTSTIVLSVHQGSTWKGLLTSNFDTATWTHAVVTVSGSNMKLYKNGVLVGTNTDGHEPNVVTRTQHWLGRSTSYNGGYFDGTIAYLKIWHGVEVEKLPPEYSPLLRHCRL